MPEILVLSFHPLFEGYELLGNLIILSILIIIIRTVMPVWHHICRSLYACINGCLYGCQNTILTQFLSSVSFCFKYNLNNSWCCTLHILPSLIMRKLLLRCCCCCLACSLCCMCSSVSVTMRVSAFNTKSSFGLHFLLFLIIKCDFKWFTNLLFSVCFPVLFSCALWLRTGKRGLRPQEHTEWRQDVSRNRMLCWCSLVVKRDKVIFVRVQLLVCVMQMSNNWSHA